MLQEESSLESNLLNEPSGRWSTISIHDRQPSSSTIVSLAGVEEQGSLKGILPSSEPTTQRPTEETPHLVRSTLSLNRTRELIMHLTRAMVDIQRNIDTTILLNMDEMQDLTDMRLRADQLRADQLRRRLYWEKIELVPYVLDKPRIVCNDIACKDYRDDGSGTQRTIYKSICQEECYMIGVPLDVLGHVELAKCAAFDGKGNCQVCGHHWENHLHVISELKEEMVTVKDEAVEAHLTMIASDITLKEAAIQNRKNMIAETDYEYQEIQYAAVRFGLFLRQISITPYNDGTLIYLDHLIKEETEKVNITRASRKRLDSLLRRRLEHVHLVEVLTKNMESGADGKLLDEADVETLVEHLYKLKLWGKNLRAVLPTFLNPHTEARPFR